MWSVAPTALPFSCGRASSQVRKGVRFFNGPSDAFDLHRVAWLKLVSNILSRALPFHHELRYIAKPIAGSYSIDVYEKLQRQQEASSTMRLKLILPGGRIYRTPCSA